MTPRITVARAADGDPLVFDVRVQEQRTETRHGVTLSQGHFVRLSHGATAEDVIEAAFRFLLDREPKEAILRQFDVSVISRYFPEFEKTLPEYLA